MHFQKLTHSSKNFKRIIFLPSVRSTNDFRLAELKIFSCEKENSILILLLLFFSVFYDLFIVMEFQFSFSNLHGPFSVVLSFVFRRSIFYSFLTQGLFFPYSETKRVSIKFITNTRNPVER